MKTPIHRLLAGLLTAAVSLALCSCSPPHVADAREANTRAQNTTLPETPPLAQFSREEHYEMTNTQFVSYYQGHNTRTDAVGQGVVSIDNARNRLNYQIDRDQGRVYAVARAIGFRDGPRYWEGNPHATRLGPCTVNGVRGVEWSHPAMQYVSERRACISNDGVLLRTSQDGHVTMQLTKLVRRDIPDAMFDPPAGAQIVSPGEMGQILAREYKTTCHPTGPRSQTCITTPR
jgi:hypothetical protein